MQKIIVSLSLLLLVGCATDVPVESLNQRDMSTIYNSAADLLEKKEYKLAADEFLNIEEEIDHTIFFEDQTLKDLCSRIHTLQLK